jgi:hypothetical protein
MCTKKEDFSKNEMERGATGKSCLSTCCFFCSIVVPGNFSLSLTVAECWEGRTNRRIMHHESRKQQHTKKQQNTSSWHDTQQVRDDNRREGWIDNKTTDFLPSFLIFSGSTTRENRKNQSVPGVTEIGRNKPGISGRKERLEWVDSMRMDWDECFAALCRLSSCFSYHLKVLGH